MAGGLPLYRGGSSEGAPWREGVCRGAFEAFVFDTKIKGGSRFNEVLTRAMVQTDKRPEKSGHSVCEYKRHGVRPVFFFFEGKFQ